MKRIELYLCEQMNCSLSDIKSNQIVVTKKEINRPYIKVLAYQNATVVCCSENYFDKIKELVKDKSRDEVFELPFIYGQTLHYVYDSSKTKPLYLFSDYEYQFIEDHFDDYMSFGNAVDTDTKQVVIAKKNGEVAGVAGASMITKDIYEVGIDVKETYRHIGLGSQLVQFLSGKLVSENIIPIYSVSTTNIASQRIARNCGYKVVWVDTFGTINDQFDVYKNIRK